MTSKSIATDLIENIAKEHETSDPANAKVTTKSLESALQHNCLSNPPVDGMTGRI
jgi:hypothetical protein